MKAVMVHAVDRFAGKTLVALGIGEYFREMGRKVGYIKPVGTLPLWTEEHGLTDQDVLFFSQTLGLEDPMELMAPYVVTRDRLRRVFRGEEEAAPVAFRAFLEISKGKDLVIVGGGGSVHEGTFLGLSGFQVSREWDVPVLLVAPYDEGLRSLDLVLDARERLGERLLGVVVNKVPAHGRQILLEDVVPYMGGRGVRTLGIIPLDPGLQALSLEEILAITGGRLLTGFPAHEVLVEGFLLGSMGLEAAVPYFRKGKGKALIAPADRSDLMLAALECPISALIVTEGLPPLDCVLQRAEERRVPVVLVDMDTLSTVELLDMRWGMAALRGKKKVTRAAELVKVSLDWESFLSLLGME